MSTGYQTITENAISGRFYNATLTPGSLLGEIVAIGQEYHLASENTTQMNLFHGEPKSFASQDITEGMKKYTPLCRELAAYIACVCGRGVLIVQSAGKNPLRRSHFFFGQTQDIEFAGRLQRALAENVWLYTGYKMAPYDRASDDAFERGTIIGLLRKTLTSFGSETSNDKQVDLIASRKEAIPRGARAEGRGGIMAQGARFTL